MSCSPEFGMKPDSRRIRSEDMIAGFVIWSAVSLLLFGIGIWSWRSEKAVGFYTGVKPPEVTDVRAYNRSVGKLWFAYAALLELLYIPLMIPALHDTGILWLGLGTPVITIGLLIGYHRILQRYKKA